MKQSWFPDINTTAAANNTGFYTRQGYLTRNPNPKCSFQCAIPMRHMPDRLQLIRKDDNDALFRTAAAGVGKGSIVYTRVVCTDCSTKRCT